MLSRGAFEREKKKQAGMQFLHSRRGRTPQTSPQIRSSVLPLVTYFFIILRHCLLKMELRLRKLTPDKTPLCTIVWKELTGCHYTRCGWNSEMGTVFFSYQMRLMRCREILGPGKGRLSPWNF